MEQKSKSDKKILIPAILAAVLAAVFVLLLIYRNMPEQKYQRKLVTGTRYLQQLDFENAVLNFQDAIEIRPEKTDAYVMSASANLRWGNEIYDSGISDGEVDYLIWSNEKLTEAAEAYEKVIALEAERVDAEDSTASTVSVYYEPLISVYTLQADRYADVDSAASEEYAAKAADAEQRYQSALEESGVTGSDASNNSDTADAGADEEAEGVTSAGAAEESASDSASSTDSESTDAEDTAVSEDSNTLETNALMIRSIYKYGDTAYGTGQALEANADLYPELSAVLETQAGEIEQELQAFIDEVASSDYDTGDSYNSNFYETGLTLGLMTGQYVSVLNGSSVYWYMSAHGSSYTNGYTYDTQTGEQKKFTDFIGADNDTVARAVINALTDRYGANTVEALDEYMSYADGLTVAITDMFAQDLEDQESSGLSWYLQSDGIHLIFDQYMIGPYAAGSFEVVLSYETNADLFREIPELGDTSEHGQLRMGYPLNTTGSSSGYSSYTYFNGDSYYESYTFVYNDSEYTREEYLLGIENVYYLERGDQLFCYIIMYAEDSYEAVDVYDLSDGSIRYVGTLGNAELYYYDGDNSTYGHYMIWTDPENIYLYSNFSILSTGLAGRSYHIGDDGMLVANSDWYEYGWMVHSSMTTEQAVPAEKIADTDLAEVPDSGESITIPAGTVLYFYRTDGETKTDMKAEDGTIYRITVDAKEWPRTIGGTNIEDVFDEPMFAG